MGLTMVEKILARASGQKEVRAGQVVEPKVSLAMSHENAALVINQFLEIYRDTGLKPKVWDPDKIAIIFDHRIPAESSKTATNQKKSGNLWLPKKSKSSTISEGMRAVSAIRYFRKRLRSAGHSGSWDRQPYDLSRGAGGF